MQQKLHRRAALAAIAALSIFTVSPKVSSAAQEKPISIAIQYGYAYLPVVVADQKGFFSKQLAARGIDTSVEIKKISGAPAINDALISGTVDIGAYGLPGMLIAAEKTKSSIKIRGLAALVAGDNGFYTNKSEIKDLKDLGANDRIAVTSTTGQQGLLVRMAAKKAFGDAKHFDTMMVQLPHPDATSGLLAGGTISAYVAPHPYSDVLEANAKIHKLFNFSDYLGQQVTSGLLATTGKFIDERKEASLAIVAAIDEAGNFIRENPKEAADIFLGSEKSSLNADQIQKMLESVKDEWGVHPKGVMIFADFMTETRLLKSKLAQWQDVFFDPVATGQGT
ncbi:ABC transporter substrate-binding protein [Agrobacterium pusense]|uniref:ABC transporter substrate-binding protein n=1 Tax=Agrobacterium pusense TaxID=648995 RepID=UPI001C6F30E4|nr:ABC transporter substrate-binding protein [Agrobacterium pusense]MBW9071276.1 ABC transporter substrate-binding protein [Agrobacterium pusense]MBW9084349.1 ABC transporter substrate-binding protein [Agrobacterium pusense]MBW9124061.1 ABC transporter substrate-binding protein [Agrobacterium pusense]MBW9137247.1 ABC transporter substrate-binding protein [Agrobacterium pusense]